MTQHACTPPKIRVCSNSHEYLSSIYACVTFNPPLTGHQMPPEPAGFNAHAQNNHASSPDKDMVVMWQSLLRGYGGGAFLWEKVVGVLD